METCGRAATYGCEGPEVAGQASRRAGHGGPSRGEIPHLPVLVAPSQRHFINVSLLTQKGGCYRRCSAPWLVQSLKLRTTRRVSACPLPD